MFYLNQHFPGSQFIDELGDRQRDLYRLQPSEMIGHYNREREALDSYRGRQLLELLQNADDACLNYDGEKKLLFQLSKDYLIAANTGQSFSREGIESLIISDNSPKQLLRSRCIGNKGLGFRAVLSWSNCPIIVSGDFLLAFSAEYAKEAAFSLASELPALHDKFDQWQKAERSCPAPIMRFPYVPDLDSPYVKEALKIRNEGYSTIILLPLPHDQRRMTIFQEILFQLENLSGENVIFCYHLEHLAVEGEISRSWQLIRQNKGLKQTLIIEDNIDHTDKIWTVYRLQGKLPDNLINQELQKTPEFELAVAVPEVFENPENNRLCVFFPTEDILPMAMLTHATLETDGSRKRIVPHDANKFVLRQLAVFMSEIAEASTSDSSSHLGLKLLAGGQKCDPELVSLGFKDSLIEACREKKLFRRLDNHWERAEWVRKPSHNVWNEVAISTYFPEVLEPSEDKAVNDLLASFELKWLADGEIASRLEEWAKELSPFQAGTIFGKLLGAGQIPLYPLPAILVSAEGSTLSTNHTAFLPGVCSISLPNWVKNFGFIDASFAEAMQTEIGATTVRELRQRLVNVGYKVEDFQLESLARHLLQEAEEREREHPEKAIETCRDILRCIYEMSKFQGDVQGPIKPSLNVITISGRIRNAFECYLGPDYPHGQLIYSLYNPLREDEFVGASETLGLAGGPLDVERFLLRIGVASEPRSKEIKHWQLAETGLEDFKDYIIESLPYPNRYFGQEFGSSDEFKKEFWSFSISGLSIPDRLDKILALGTPEAIIAYFSTEGSDYISTESANATFQAKTGSQRTPRQYPAVPIPNPALYLLNNYTWVPCEDGQRRQPGQIILTRAGSKAFRGTFFNHAIKGEHDLLKNRGGRGCVDAFLLRLGAIHSLDSLKPEELYKLLLELPETDPSGDIAPTIYRTLLEHGGLETESYQRERFVRDGKMFGILNDNKGYYPVCNLKYASRTTFPRPVYKRIPLVDIDPRRNSNDIERIFGVSALKAEDVSIALEENLTEFQPWSHIAEHRVKIALPYLYAFRLSRTADEAGREQRRLSRVQVQICRRIGAKITLFNGPEEQIIMEDDLEGLVIANRMLLVNLNEEMPGGDQVFWLAVGDLFSDLLGLAISSEFASLLACDNEFQMRRLLDRMTAKRSDELLEKARLNLSIEEEEPERIIYLLPPKPAQPPAGETNTEIVEGIPAKQSGPDNNEFPSHPIFPPIEAPKPVPKGHRHLVVTGRTQAPRSLQGRTVMAQEDLTLQVVIAFEKSLGQNRFPIRVEHIRGLESLGCDIISVASEEVQKQILVTRELNIDEVGRFIEVKGRTNRTGVIELSENQMTAAQNFGERFFLYRVYQNPTNLSHFELAILCNPLKSEALKVIRLTQFDLRAGSGAQWFQLLEQDDFEESELKS